MEQLVFLLAAAGAGLIIAALGLFGLGRWFQRREPYRTFLRLKARQKLTFFRRLLTHPRVPWYVKVIPFALALYLATPIDLIPDFVPVLGYLDDVAIVLVAVALVLKLSGSAVHEVLQDLAGQENDARQ